MLRILCYVDFLFISLEHENNLEFLSKKFCLCFQLYLLHNRLKRAYIPLDPKYEWAHFVFRSMLLLPIAYLPFSTG